VQIANAHAARLLHLSVVERLQPASTFMMVDLPVPLAPTSAVFSRLGSANWLPETELADRTACRHLQGEHLPLFSQSTCGAASGSLFARNGFLMQLPVVEPAAFRLRDALAYGRISTGVPTGTRFQISSISSSVTAMQPSVQS